MPHHSQYITDINCDIIIAEAAKAVVLNRRSTKFCNALFFIAGQQSESPEQVIAYAIEQHAVEKGDVLAEEIYKLYRKSSRTK